MAPRTPRQQKAYNAKRRAETAAKKAPPPPKGKSAAPKKKAVVKAEAKRKRVVYARQDPRYPDVPRTIISAPEPTSTLLTEAANAAAAGAKVSVTFHGPGGGGGGGRDNPPPPVENIKVNKLVLSHGSPPLHTMPRSYVRHSGAGMGKLRNGTYQCTVSFTEPQMRQVRAASQLRNVSLAEMIRSCVVEHLNKGIR